MLSDIKDKLSDNKTILSDIQFMLSGKLDVIFEPI